jgi:hypothetical protein
MTVCQSSVGVMAMILRHGLRGLTNLESVLGHPVAGARWEGVVIEQLLAAAQVAGQR